MDAASNKKGKARRVEDTFTYSEFNHTTLPVFSLLVCSLWILTKAK